MSLEISLSLLGFISTFGLFVISPTLPLYVESFGVSYATLGLFFSTYSLTWTVLQLYTGHLSDRYGRLRFVVIGLVVYGLFATASGLAQDFAQLFIFRLLQGVGLGLYGPAALGLAAQSESKGKVFAFYRSAQTAGIIFAPIVGGWLGRWSLGYPFFASALTSGLAILAVAPLRELPQGEGSSESFLTLARAALSRPNFTLLCLAAFLAELTFVALDIVVPLVGGSWGLSTQTIGLILSTYFIVFTLLQVPIGFLSERMERRRVLLTCAFLATLTFVGLFFASTSWQLGLGMAVLGATLGAIFVQTGAWVAELAPVEQKSLYMAFFDAIIDFAFVVMPALVGLLGGFQIGLSFLLCAFLVLGAGGVLVFVSQTPSHGRRVG
ncbi:MAG: MFS transporter [Anaerolineae bacterium]